MSLIKTPIKLIAAILVLTAALIFFSYTRQEQKDIEKIMNNIYFEYQDTPENFVVTEAEIIEEYDCQTGSRLKFFSSTNQWRVKVKINDDFYCETHVMRDVENENVGDVIQVAYKINRNDEYSVDNLKATQLEYIEDAPAMKSYAIVMTVIALLLLATILYTVYFLFKSK